MNTDPFSARSRCTTAIKRALGMLSLTFLSLGSASAQTAEPETAKTWPTKPVKMVVGFGSGGVFDVLGRAITEKLTQYNGQPFVIENRPGAAGSFGAGVVARAEPDGYQLLLTPGSVLTMNPSLYSKLPFDDDSFTPVSLLADMAIMLVVQAENPASNLSEFIAATKRGAGKVFFASPGAGSSLHLALELFQRTADVSIQHVAYKSGGEMVTAVLSGQATGLFSNPPQVMAQIKAGKLRALGIAGNTRLPQLPDVPTTAEAGLAAFDMASWFGLVAPAKTPRAVVDQLSAQVTRALREPDVQKRLVDFGVRPIGGNPEEFAAFWKKDRAKWDGIIRAANIRLE